LVTFLTFLVVSILFTCAVHRNLCDFIDLTIFVCLLCNNTINNLLWLIVSAFYSDHASFRIKERPYISLKRTVWCCCMLVYSVNV
jgi:hypothetical protein